MRRALAIVSLLVLAAGLAAIATNYLGGGQREVAIGTSLRFSEHPEPR